MRTLTELRHDADARPGDAKAVAALGQALIARREYVEGLRCLRRASQLDSRTADYPYRLGLILDELGEWDEAVASLEHARRLEPGAAHVLSALGWTYAASLQRPDVARRIFLDLLARKSAPEALVGLCRTLIADGSSPSTARDFVVEVCGERVDPASIPQALATALRQYGRYQEAAQCLSELVAREPAARDALADLAEIICALGDGPRAAALFQQAVTPWPVGRVAIWKYLTFLFRTGEYRLAQVLYRRADTQQVLRRGERDRTPRWTGSPLDGGTLLLRTPGGGYGDLIQLARFADLATRLGGRVLLECATPIQSLLASHSHVCVCLPYDEVSYDVLAHAEAAIMWLDWDWSSLARQVPFLRPPAARVARWRALLSREPAFNVGVSWRAGGSHAWHFDCYTSRSMPVACLRSLLEVPGIVCHNLCVGVPATREWQALSPPMPLRPMSEAFGDFAETAAAIQAMDLVVSVDTVTAHIAGALGRPCLLLLPFAADSRWTETAPACRWYPSLHVFRQPAPGDWASVMTEVCDYVRRRAAAAVEVTP